MDTYLCPVCQKTHKVFHGLEIPPPSWINALSSTEKENQVKELDGLIIVDENQVFMKVTVEIFLEGTESRCFFWNCWGETNIQELGPLIPRLRQGEVVSFSGTMPSIPMFYGSDEDLSCTFTIFPDEGKTIATVETDSRIKEDQAQPITKERLIELMNHVHHHPKRKEHEVDNRPFRDRLLEYLQAAKSDFIDQGKEVCLTVQHASAVGLQIVSSSVLELKGKGVTGFGLHLPFDEPEATLKRFKKHDQFGEYHHHVWDGIPTWQRDCGMDTERLVEVTERLLLDVYQVELEDVEFDMFEL